MEILELKNKLNNIKKNNFAIEKGENYFLYSKIMMENIGVLDSELRDDLIYEILCNWIIEGKLSEEEMKEILKIALDNDHIFYKLKEKDEDAVYTRSFSMLIIALIIYVHRKNKFLHNEIIFEVMDKVLDYINDEKDLRGYVSERGWAHAIAHVSDVLDELANCTCIKEVNLIKILNSIRNKASVGYYVYIDEESERMVNAVESVLNRKVVNEEYILNWLKGFKVEGENYIEKYHSKVNCKGFLRTLYFRVIDIEEYQYIRDEIKNILKNL